MKTPLPRTIAVLAWLAVAVAPAACSDRNPLGGVPRPTPGGGKIVSELHCTASRSGQLDCHEVGSGTTGADDGTPRVILGGGKVKLRSRNPHYDSATHVFEFEVNLQNLLTEPIGTPDGTTAAGSKVFYYTAPYVSSYSAPGDTGSVTVTNADGYGNFTGPHQAYYTYPQILQPQDSTPYKRWELKFPPSVNTFSFALKVFTWIASEPPVPVRAPHGAPAWFYAAANQQDCVGVIAGKCVRNVVQLLFNPTATAEERITALNSVGGVVVGGDSAVNIYYVKVSGDSTTAGLQTALRVLRSLPQVAGAHAYSAELPTGEYRKPYDAQAWRQWKLSPDSADGENWAWSVWRRRTPGGAAPERGPAWPWWTMGSSPSRT